MEGGLTLWALSALASQGCLAESRPCRGSEPQAEPAAGRHLAEPVETTVQLCADSCGKLGGLSVRPASIPALFPSPAPTSLGLTCRPTAGRGNALLSWDAVGLKKDQV